MRLEGDLTPGAILSAGNEIYVPASDWGVENYKFYDARYEGDLVLTPNDTIEEYTANVVGPHQAANYGTGVFTYADGTWFTNGTNTASPTDLPQNSTYAVDEIPHKAGNVIFHEDTPGVGVSFYTANANMMGALKTTGATAYAAGSVINVQDVYVSIGNDHEGLWSNSAAYTTGETVVHGIGPNRRLYQALGASTGTEPAAGGNASWTDLGAVDSSSSWTGAAGVANVDALVKDKDNAAYWTRSIWQLGEPDTTNGGRRDVTDSFIILIILCVGLSRIILISWAKPSGQAMSEVIISCIKVRTIYM